MARKSIAAFVLVALIGAAAFSVTGQEDALPVVTPKTTLNSIPLGEPTIALAVEPFREFVPPTLVEAARNNDYVSFSALYADAVKRGEDVSRFATLHELWTYAITDPIGAFYGADMYAKLNRAYPGYAAFIAEHKIVDSRGNVFYPTSETRAFLLDRAVEGRAPKVQLADDALITPRPQRSNVTAPASRSRTSAPASIPAKTTAQPVPTATPNVVTPKVETAPAQTAPAQIAPAQTAVADPVVITPTPTPAPAPVATETAALPTRDNPTGRGILLVIVGLIGVGLLALILRTPREQAQVTIIPAEPHPNNVEPLRKPETPAPAPPPAAGTKAS